MKVRECIALVLRGLAKERKPYNLLAQYTGKYRKHAVKSMELFQNFEAKADEIALRMAAGKADVYHTLGGTVMEKSSLKVLEKEGTLPTTVDLLYAGDGEVEITGIGCTFMATLPVLKEAKRKGINFIITHEPTYYSGRDAVDWLANDAVYQKKRKFLEDSGISVWRCHDMMHLFQPDMIVEGVLNELGLADKATYRTAADVIIEGEFTRREIYSLLCEKLNCKNIRMAGKMDGKANKIGFFVGSLGGKPQIALDSQYDLDLMICGEINEWETAPYVCDAVSAGKDTALFVIGHQESETAGMKFMAEWLNSMTGDIPVQYLESGPMLLPVEQ